MAYNMSLLDKTIERALNLTTSGQHTLASSISLKGRHLLKGRLRSRPLYGVFNALPPLKPHTNPAQVLVNGAFGFPKMRGRGYPGALKPGFKQIYQVMRGRGNGHQPHLLKVAHGARQM